MPLNVNGVNIPDGGNINLNVAPGGGAPAVIKVNGNIVWQDIVPIYVSFNGPSIAQAAGTLRFRYQEKIVNEVYFDSALAGSLGTPFVYNPVTKLFEALNVIISPSVVRMRSNGDNTFNLENASGGNGVGTLTFNSTTHLWSGSTYYNNNHQSPGTIGTKTWLVETSNGLIRTAINDGGTVFNGDWYAPTTSEDTTYSLIPADLSGDGTIIGFKQDQAPIGGSLSPDNIAGNIINQLTVSPLSFNTAFLQPQSMSYTGILWIVNDQLGIAVDLKTGSGTYVEWATSNFVASIVTRVGITTTITLRPY